MKKNEDYIRSAVFGFEDALVSTTGVIVGIATATSNKQFVILAALVTILVEAVSMAAGQYLTERTIHEIENAKHTDSPTIGALIMFFSYFIGGAIPALPILLLPLPFAIWPAILFAFFGLFALGWFKGKFVKISPIRSAMEMLVIGGIATIIGVLAGYFLKT